MANEEKSPHHLQTAITGPDNQLQSGSNYSGSFQTPTVKPDSQLSTGSTVNLENCSGPTAVGAGNDIHVHYHYHFHLPSDTQGVETGHTEHREWGEHQMEALGRGLQQLQLPPCDNNSEEVKEEEEETVDSEEITGHQNLEECSENSLWSFLFRIFCGLPKTGRMLVPEGTVCIIDSEGRVLEPGDAVHIARVGVFDSDTWAIYVGNQEVVLCRWQTSRLVVKERLNLAQPFKKLKVLRNRLWCQVFPPQERIQRALSLVGVEFKEGERLFGGSDFHLWVYAGVGFIQLGRRNQILWVPGINVCRIKEIFAVWHQVI